MKDWDRVRVICQYFGRRERYCAKKYQSRREYFILLIKVVSSVELRDFSFDLIPLDQDVLSLEMHDAFRDMTIENDLSIYNYVAESISRI